MIRKLFAIALLAFACGGVVSGPDELDAVEHSAVEDNEPDELGVVQEGLAAQCLSPGKYGVDVAGLPHACDVNNPAYVCAFPSVVGALTVSLNNGFTSSERSLILAAGQSSVATWNQVLPEWNSPTKKWEFGSLVAAPVVINKGTIPGAVSGNAAAWTSLASIVSDSSTALVENYPMAGAQRVFNWRVTLDSAKIAAWVGSSGNDYNRVMYNVIQHVYSFISGLGLQGTASGSSVSHNIERLVAQTQPPADNLSWAKNFALNCNVHPHCGDSILACY
jgi:hypothetical protein